MSEEMSYIKSKNLVITDGKLINSVTRKTLSDKAYNDLILDFCKTFDYTPNAAEEWIKKQLASSQSKAEDNASLEFYPLDVYDYRNINWNEADQRLWSKYFSAYKNKAYNNPMIFCHDPQRKQITLLNEWEIGQNDKGNGVVSTGLETHYGANLERAIYSELIAIEDEIAGMIKADPASFKRDKDITDLFYEKYPASILTYSAVIHCARPNGSYPRIRIISPRSNIISKALSVPMHIATIAPKLIEHCGVSTQPIFWSTDPSVLALNFTNIEDEISNGSDDIKDWIGVEKKIIAGTGEDAVAVWRHAVVSILNFKNNSRQAIFLCGVGQIGKSAIQRAFTKALGNAACSEDAGTLLKDFNMNTFGKRLISVADCKDFVNVTKSGKFQRITGNDLMRFEGKGANPFSWEAGSQKLLFTMNAIPAVNMHDQAERTRIAVFNLALPEDCDDAVKPNENGFAQGDHNYTNRLANSLWAYYKFCLQSDIDNGINPESDVIPSLSMLDLFEGNETESQMIVNRFINEFLEFKPDSKFGMKKKDITSLYAMYLRGISTTTQKYTDFDALWKQLMNFIGDKKTKFYGMAYTNIVDESTGARTKGLKGLQLQPGAMEKLAAMDSSRSTYHSPHVIKPEDASEAIPLGVA